MSLLQPTQEMIETIIFEANHTPSADNAQPWKFKWDGDKLTVLHSEKRASHSLNCNNHASLLALGTLLEAMTISSTQYGFQTHVQLVLESQPELSEWAVVRFTYTNVSPDPLFPMIKVRQTDRRVYLGGKMTQEMWQRIQLIKNEYVGCRVRKLEVIDRPFLDYFLKAEEVMWKNARFIKDIARWVRLTKKEIKQTRDGMSWKNIGLNNFEAVLFKLVRRFPMFPKMVWSLGFGLRVKKEARQALFSSKALLCFTGNPNEPLSFFQVGRMGYRIWLLLNSQGHAVQPLSFSSLSIADVMSGKSRESVGFFQEGLNIFQKSFSLNPNEIPIWMFRTGIAPSGTPERTSRHQIDELLIKKN